MDFQPSSTNWFDLPAEMREMVIDRMDPKTRCRFAECSKFCEKEAKKSKNYLYGISILSSMCGSFEIMIGHDKEKPDYTLKFIANGTNMTTVVYETGQQSWYSVLEGKQKWQKVENGPPYLVRTRYAKRYLEKYENSIRQFRFRGKYFELGDMSINGLRKLIELKTFFEEYYNCASVSIFKYGFIDLKKFLRIETISTSRIKFTFDQIVNFRGKFAYLSSDKFNEKTIRKYLEMWKNGEIHENVERVRIDFITRGMGDVKNVAIGLDPYDYREIYVDDESPKCLFYSKCDVRGNKWFYVWYESFNYLAVEWKEPEFK